jgi:tetratricopeptide (TPR) repeat protein
MNTDRGSEPMRARRAGGWIHVVFLAACAVAPAGARAAAPQNDLPPPGKIRDLDYGDVLFHFYQDDYFDALVRLEAAQDFGRMPHHDADADLLAGGLYLSLGMHVEATRIFDRLLAGSVPQSVSDRARFYLARIGYQRGYYDQAWHSLQQIRGSLPGSLESERRLLSANVLMAQGRYAEAASALQAAGTDQDWAPYARFNLGVALVRSGDVAQGQRWLEAVGTMPAGSEEARSLRDRANLALGYAMLQQKDAEPAVAALTRVRLDGPFTNRALLGLGWAESDALRPDRALVPWLELRQRRLLDSSVQESYLAVPYAYAQLASNGQAAQQYRFAVKAYADESRRIDESIAAIRGGGFLDSVLAAAPASDVVGWFWQLQNVPDAPQTRYLYHLLASHEFQEGLKNFRDLHIMQRNLEGWRESLAAFDEMVATREQASLEREPHRAATLAGADLDGLGSRQAALEEEVAVIESSRDVAALATDSESRNWRQLEDAQVRIAMLPAGPQREALAERARLLRGALLWQMDAAYKARLRRVQVDLQETGALLAEARDRTVRVEAAGVSAPRSTAGFAARVSELARRVDEIGPRIAAARAAQERVLAGIAVNELEAQKRRLASYSTQAQFALAAIYDGASAGVVR